MGAPIGNCNAGKYSCSPSGTSAPKAGGIGKVTMKQSYKAKLIAKHTSGKILPLKSPRDIETNRTKKFMGRWQSMNNKS
jgi:hypothetical protein